MSRSIPAILAAGLVAAAVAFAPSSVASGATPGPISVQQILVLFDTLDSDPEAGKLLFAYLAGVGETAGALISSAKQQGGFAGCGKSLTLDGDTVQAALRKVGGDTAKRAATPIIVEDMLMRAECK